MLERFSAQACRAMVLAREEAITLNHNWIGTEHMMLGLIREDSGLAAKALRSLGISLETARWLVEQVVGRGEQEQAPPGQLQFTPRAKKLLEMASGLAAGSDRVGTEHILSALIREGEGVGAMVLSILGADQNRVGFRVIQLKDGDRAAEDSRLLDNPLARIDTLDRRLAAVERSLGLPPDPGDLDQRIEEARPETETAVDMQEFETTTGLRGHETRRLAPRSPREQRLERAAAHPVPLARELGRMYTELDRLRAILRQHNIDPGDDPG